jgi:hypothetical protein
LLAWTGSFFVNVAVAVTEGFSLGIEEGGFQTIQCRGTPCPTHLSFNFPPSIDLADLMPSSIFACGRGTSTHYLVFPLWIPMLFTTAAAALVGRRVRRGAARRRCKKCDYDMRFNVTGRCPECGTPYTSPITSAA